MQTRRIRFSRASRRIFVALSLLFILTLSRGLWDSPALHASDDAAIETTLAHFAPFADTLFRSEVNVTIDGKNVASELPYLQLVDGLSLETGPHEVVVDPPEWPNGTFTQTIDIPVPPVEFKNAGAVLAIAGGTSGIRASVFVHLIERSAPVSGVTARLTHLAPYSVNGESDYTLCNADGTIFYGLQNVGYGKSSAYVDVPAGIYSVYLSGGHAGCDERLIKDAFIIFDEGSIGDLYAVGTNASNTPYFRNALTVVSASAVVMSNEAYLPVLMR